MRSWPLTLKVTAASWSPNPCRKPIWSGSCAPWMLRFQAGNMDPFPIAKTSWEPGDTREVEQSRVHKEIGMEYDSYRRIYIAEGHEWKIAGQIAREDGKKYYIFECVG